MNKQRKKSNLSPEDKSVIAAMAQMDLKPGEMLLVGPVAVRALGGQDEYSPAKLKGHVHRIPKSEWSRV